jgi:hypothetical protein
MKRLTKREARNLINKLLDKTGTYIDMAETLNEPNAQTCRNWYYRGSIPKKKVVRILGAIND